MEKEVSGEPRHNKVITSEVFENQRLDVYKYGFSTFGIIEAEKYRHLIRKHIRMLEFHSEMYPECPYLPTKNHRYRNIILPSHRIIYRITPTRIEVLAILHLASSINAIRRTRSIKI